MNIPLSDILNAIDSLSLEEINQITGKTGARKGSLLDEARKEHKKKFDESLKFLVANPPSNSSSDKEFMSVLKDVCIAFGYSSDDFLSTEKSAKKKKANSSPLAEGEVKRTPGRLTKDQKGEVASLYSQGMKIKEIADKFGKREELIEKILKMEQK